MAGSEVRADLWMSEYITPWDIYVHGVTKVLVYKKTAYQEMLIVETGAYGKGLILDGKWQSCTGDEYLYHEPLVHPAMCFHGSPKKVLILGGGEGATAREVLRWKSVEKVVMIDIDAEVVEACREHLSEMHQNIFDEPRFQLVIGDALHFLDTTTEQWDVVISDLSDPIESGPSFQLFTKEYFEKVRRVLLPDGFFVIQAGPVSPAEMKLHARLVNTMKAVFPNVKSYSSFTPTYGGPWGFVLASEQPLAERPQPEAIDKLLAEKTTGGFRMFDGITLLGILQIPLHLRQAIATETEIFTLAKPPKFFGKGSISQ
ncbi:MAG: fused MFS/spermidine synthase [Oscillatoriaceae bacterium SKYG93]|nr:fused MFS/spermidine synthase [Oscillatoriaceae bacterium SKYG93]MDW8454582.1 fused MFS/spermidine synthase [Oscillatoriaceae cyanobacterium SKYGB_i_bin93]